MSPGKPTVFPAMSLKWSVCQKAGAASSKRESEPWGGEQYKHASYSLCSLVHTRYAPVTVAPYTLLGF